MIIPFPSFRKINCTVTFSEAVYNTTGRDRKSATVSTPPPVSYKAWVIPWSQAGPPNFIKPAGIRLSGQFLTGILEGVSSLPSDIKNGMEAQIVWNQGYSQTAYYLVRVMANPDIQVNMGGGFPVLFSAQEVF